MLCHSIRIAVLASVLIHAANLVAQTPRNLEVRASQDTRYQRWLPMPTDPDNSSVEWIQELSKSFEQFQSQNQNRLGKLPVDKPTKEQSLNKRPTAKSPIPEPAPSDEKNGPRNRGLREPPKTAPSPKMDLKQLQQLQEMMKQFGGAESLPKDMLSKALNDPKIQEQAKELLKQYKQLPSTDPSANTESNASNSESDPKSDEPPESTPPRANPRNPTNKPGTSASKPDNSQPPVNRYSGPNTPRSTTPKSNSTESNKTPSREFLKSIQELAKEIQNSGNDFVDKDRATQSGDDEAATDQNASQNRQKVELNSSPVTDSNRSANSKSDGSTNRRSPRPSTKEPNWGNDLADLGKSLGIDGSKSLDKKTLDKKSLDNLDVKRNLEEKGFSKTLQDIVAKAKEASRELPKDSLSAPDASSNGELDSNKNWADALANALDSSRNKSPDAKPKSNAAPPKPPRPFERTTQPKPSSAPKPSDESSWAKSITKGLNDLAKDMNKTPKSRSATQPSSSQPSSSSSPSVGTLSLPNWNLNSVGMVLLAMFMLVAAIGLIWFVLKQQKQKQIEAVETMKATELLRTPSKIRTRADVIRAFHQLAYRISHPAESWWTSNKVATQAIRVLPTRANAMVVAVDVYDQSRYLPEEVQLSEEQLDSVRGAIQALDPIKG